MPKNLVPYGCGGGGGDDDDDDDEHHDGGDDGIDPSGDGQTDKSVNTATDVVASEFLPGRRPVPR